MRLTILLSFALASGIAYGQSSDIEASVREALQADIRTAEERARDANRMPAEVLAFFGLEQDMRVIEILPFSGWYTKILGTVLAENGKLYITHPAPTRYSALFDGVTELEGLGDVSEVDWGAEAPNDDDPFFASGTWDVEPVDMVLTFRNYHNFSRDERMAVNESAFGALKPGGVYGIVDHTRRHMEADDRANGRRVDPVLVIKEVEAAGFEFVDYSDLLHRPQDELVYEVGVDSVSGNTDRFTLLFRKPD